MFKKSKPQTVTTLSNDNEDYKKRILSYSIIMGIRIISIILVFLIPYPWNMIPLLPAIFAGWFAVVIANAKKASSVNKIEKPYKAIE